MSTRQAGSAWTPTEAGTGARLHVLSRLRLLAQAVSTGLAGQQLAVQALPYPPQDVALPDRVLATDVVILLDDLGTRADLRRVLRLVAATPARWLVLATRPSDVVRGALLDGGVAAVMDDSASLDDVTGTVRTLLEGRDPVDPALRSRLLTQWTTEQARDLELTTRLASLTERERFTLHLLEQGYDVAAIAERAGATEAAVRSRLRNVLRKLGVHTRLAAVVAARRAREVSV